MLKIKKESAAVIPTFSPALPSGQHAGSHWESLHAGLAGLGIFGPQGAYTSLCVLCCVKGKTTHIVILGEKLIFQNILQHVIHVKTKNNCAKAATESHAIFCVVFIIMFMH